MIRRMQNPHSESGDYVGNYFVIPRHAPTGRRVCSCIKRHFEGVNLISLVRVALDPTTVDANRRKEFGSELTSPSASIHAPPSGTFCSQRTVRFSNAGERVVKICRTGLIAHSINPMIESKMSVTALANNNRLDLPQTNAQSGPSNASAAASTKQTAGSASTSQSAAAGAEASAQVALSANAQILAMLSAAGYTFAVTDGGGKPVGMPGASNLNLPAQSPSQSMADYASQVFNQLVEQNTGADITMSMGGITMGSGPLDLPPASSDGYAKALAQLMADPSSANSAHENANGQNGSISKSAFDAVITKFGGTQKESNQIFASFDTDGNGTVSTSELLSALSKAGSNPSDSATQTLLKLLVPLGDTSVSSSAFLSFETSMLVAEDPVP